MSILQSINAYFLVFINYNNYNRNIFATYEYLDRFFGNLLLGENNLLSNRELLIIDSNKSDTVSKTSDTVNSSSDTVNDTVLSLILENPNITANSIAERLGIGIATVKRRIKVLKDNGIIARVGSDKTGSWQVLTISK